MSAKNGVVRDKAVHLEVVEQHCILCAGTRIFRAAPFLFSDQRTGGKY